MMYFEDYQMPDNMADNPEAQRIFDIYKQIMPGHPEDETEILLDNFEDDQEVFVARDDNSNEVMGVVSYYLPRDADYIFLSGIAVDPELQGQGQVGPAMMAHLFDKVARHGRRAIEGTTLPRSRSFYARLGAYALDGDHIRIDLPSTD